MHKLNGGGLQFAVGVSAFGCHLFWINELYPCGPWTYWNMFRIDLKTQILDTEWVLHDKEYIDGKCCQLFTYFGAEESGTLFSRQETLNKWLKNFKFSQIVFGMVEAHIHACFVALSNI